MWQNFKNFRRKPRHSEPAVKKAASHCNDLPAAAAGAGDCGGAGEKKPEAAVFHLLLLRRIIIFLTTVVFFGLFAPLGVDLHHDGVMMIPALRVASGAMVFRDVFCQYGFLSPLLQAFAVLVSGGELLAIKYLSVLFYGGSAVLLDVIWARFLPPRWRDGIILLYFILMPDLLVTFHPWSSIFALFFMLLSAWLLMNSLCSGSWWMLFGAGAAAGLTFLSRHPCGVVSFVAIAGAIFCEAMIKYSGKERIKCLAVGWGIALAGSGIVLGIVGAILIMSGAWDDFVLQCFTYVFGFVQGRGSGGSLGGWRYFAASLCPFVSDSGFFDSIFAVLPFFALGWLFKAVRSAVHHPENREKMLALTALSIFAMGSWHQYYPVPCVRHIFWGGVPFFGFLVLTLKYWLQECSVRRNLYRVLAVLTVLLVIYCASQRLYSGFRRLRTSGRRAQLDLPGIRGMRLTRGEFAFITDLKSSFDSLPEAIKRRGVLNYTQNGLCEVLLPKTAFRHPQFLQMGKALYGDYDLKVMEYIQLNRPVVLSNQPLFLAGYNPVMYNKYLGEDYIIYAPDF